MKWFIVTLLLMVGCLAWSKPLQAQTDAPLIHGSRFSMGVRSGFAFWDSPGQGWPLVSRDDEWFLGVSTSYNIVPGFDLILSTDYHFDSEIFRTYVGGSLMILDGEKLFGNSALRR